MSSRYGDFDKIVAGVEHYRRPRLFDVWMAHTIHCLNIFYRNFANKYKIVCFFITFITLQIDKVVFSPSKKFNFLLVLDKKKVYSSWESSSS